MKRLSSFFDIKVRSYSNMALDDQLVEWDESFMSPESRLSKYWFIGSVLLFLGIVLLLVLRYQKGSSRESVASQLNPQDQHRKRIMSSLERGEYPLRDLEAYLHAYGDHCDRLEMAFIEKLLYAKGEAESQDFEKLTSMFQPTETRRDV